MHLEAIEYCESPKSSFIHVYGKLQNTDEYADFVINIDKINYIKKMPSDKTLIDFANTAIIVDFDYFEFMEVFLNQVNLLFHLNKK